ncbi:MAG: hypothetical protein ACFCUE_13680 [Candidatus Bathyarchaeia archaeon]|jgi:hypothetical protein
MKKMAIAGFILLFMLLFSMCPFMLHSVNATNLSVQYGHLTPVYDPDEKAFEEDVCEYIYNLFENDPGGTCIVANGYWGNTTDDIVSTWLDLQTAYADYVTTWWVGDYHASYPNYSPPPYGHLWFYGDGVNNDISDDLIYDHATAYGTTSSKQQFMFIWTCANGGVYWTDLSGSYNNITGITGPAISPFSPPPTNTNDEYGFFNSGETYGMPLAWTGYSDMNLNGYGSASGSRCYIGWEGPSIGMFYYLEDTEFCGICFPEKFYYKALGYANSGSHQTIHASLDYASQYIYDENYAQTNLYNGYWISAMYGWFYVRMRVLGNSYLTIP